MTRAEHIAWAKDRALEFVELGNLPLAVSSMISDLGKFEGEALLNTDILRRSTEVALDGREAVRTWIEGIS